MSNSFPEPCSDQSSQSAVTRHSVQLDRNDTGWRLFMDLSKYHQMLVESEGQFPEDIDRRCIDMLGIRFELLINAVFNITYRTALVDVGGTRYFDAQIFRMIVGGQSYEISKEEYESSSICRDTLMENGRNLIPFLESLPGFWSE